MAGGREDSDISKEENKSNSNDDTSKKSSSSESSDDSSDIQEDYAERLKKKENFNFVPFYLDDSKTG